MAENFLGRRAECHQLALPISLTQRANAGEELSAHSPCCEIVAAGAKSFRLASQGRRLWYRITYAAAAAARLLFTTTLGIGFRL